MNGLQMTPSPQRKSEAIPRCDGAFADWRYARETRSESWGLRTWKSTRLSTTSKYTAYRNESVFDGGNYPAAASAIERGLGRPRLAHAIAAWAFHPSRR